MAWLLDASVLLAAEDADDEHHADAVATLEGDAALLTLDLAYYESTNVAIVAWNDDAAARRLRERVAAIADDGGLVRASPELVSAAERLALEYGISVYDAAYVAAAGDCGAELVSCDVRDLVSKGLARTPHAPRAGS